MKKLIILVAMLAVAMFALPFSVCAEDENVIETLPYQTGTEESEFETLPYTEEKTSTEENVSNNAIDYDKIAKEVYDKLKDELPESLAENIEQLIESWEKTDNDATFKDRLAEFFTTDNLVSTVSMIFMVVVGLAVYIMRKSQGASIQSTNEDLKKLNKHIDTITEYITSLEKKIKEKQDSSEQARLAAVGVATMLKDIFQNSRTIDEAGKKMMNLDYLKAIGEAIEDTTEEAHKESEEVEV